MISLEKSSIKVCAFAKKNIYICANIVMQLSDYIKDLNEGSPQAFEKLYKMYSGKLYNFIFKISYGDKYMTEEVVEMAFIRIWETRSSIDPTKSFVSYLCTIAKNILMNMYQHQTVEYVYNEYIAKNSLEYDNQTEDNADLSFLNEYIDKLAATLPPQRQKIFHLSKRMHYSNKEIAAKLNISESTVGTQLSIALKYMREQLIKHYDVLLSLMFLLFVNDFK